MKRREFILVGALGIAAISIPTAKWLGLYAGWDNRLAQPTLLSHLFSRQALRALGKTYLELKPEESNCDKLAQELLGEASASIFYSTADVQAQIEEKIRRDFNNGTTIVLNGWILSVTEARQCAYFSMLNS
jgi:hypothetical protein